MRACTLSVFAFVSYSLPFRYRSRCSGSDTSLAVFFFLSLRHAAATSFYGVSWVEFPREEIKSWRPGAAAAVNNCSVRAKSIGARLFKGRRQEMTQHTNKYTTADTAFATMLATDIAVAV